MTQVIRETNTCRRHGHPAKLLLGASPMLRSSMCRAGAAKPEGQGPDPDSPPLPGHSATNFCQTEMLPVYLAGHTRQAQRERRASH